MNIKKLFSLVLQRNSENKIKRDQNRIADEQEDKEYQQKMDMQMA